jgi:predicted metal-binding membrane protein
VSSLELDAFAAARARLGLVALLVGLAALAWWSTVRAMEGMGANPGADLGTLGWFIGVWIVMMAAMMLPAVSPTVALYSRMTRQRGLARPVAFTSGYLVVWAAAGLVAYGVFALGKRVLGPDLAWHGGGRWLAGALLAAAAVYELTPLKDVCLGKCRSPFGFLLGSWRDGVRGAAGMGARHGAWCLGCCWALMVALFALGVMSLVWMAVVAALITVEKVLPWRRAAVWSTTALLLALAIGVFAAPDAIPGFVVPAGGGMMGGM